MTAKTAETATAAATAAAAAATAAAAAATPQQSERSLDSHGRELVPVVGDEDESGPVPEGGQDVPGELLGQAGPDEEDVAVADGTRLPGRRRERRPLLLHHEEAGATTDLVVDHVGERPGKWRSSKCAKIGRMRKMAQKSARSRQTGMRCVLM